MPLYPPASSGSSELIGLTVYNPGSASEPSTASTSFVDVDASNLHFSFTVPASGIVIVRLSGVGIHITAGYQYWGLRESSSDVSGTQTLGVPIEPSNGYYHTGSRVIRLSGLTPGASKTYKWAYKSSNGNTTYMAYGGNYGGASMEVWSAI